MTNKSTTEYQESTTVSDGGPEFSVREHPEQLEILGAGYRLLVSLTRSVVDLSLRGRKIARLNVASGLDTVTGFDEGTVLKAPTWTQDGDAVVVTWQGSSSLWRGKLYELRASANGFSYGYEVEGDGVIDRAHLFRTRFVPSAGDNIRIFNPEPNSGLVQYSEQRCPAGARKQCYACLPSTVPGQTDYFGPADFTTITVGRDKQFHDGNWFFTPSPFCLAIEGAGNWLSSGIAADPGEWSFSELHYPGGGFGLSLDYKGHAQVNGSWRSPRLLCLVADNEYAAVERYCDELRALGLAPTGGRGPIQDWWREPIFCGWGEQISQEVHLGDNKAPDKATQPNYGAWLNTLRVHDVNPGTVVIDDKWQQSYGLNDVDTAKWPDMPSFIAAQHQQGRHVLLWLKAWDPEGVPAAECIVDANGTPVAVDAGNPAFRERFAEQVRYMLRDLDADGFKVDFTHLIPRGPNAAHVQAMKARDAAAGYADPWPEWWAPVSSSVGGEWGLELMRQWLTILSDAARGAKPDAVIITHTANPYLADVVDVLRLNDVAGLPDIEASIVPMMSHRVSVARAASPFWLIDSDDWPCSSRAQWRDYLRAQGTGELGIPALYHAERFGWGKVDEALEEGDYAAIRLAWSEYRTTLA